LGQDGDHGGDGGEGVEVHSGGGRGEWGLMFCVLVSW
jgi:hypothetical protein